MQFSVLRLNGRILSRGAAVLVIAGVASGCSSQVARFNGGSGVDGIFTASTPNQRAIIPQNGTQPYPADSQPIAAAPVDGTYSGSVSRGALAPVSDRRRARRQPSRSRYALPRRRPWRRAEDYYHVRRRAPSAAAGRGAGRRQGLVACRRHPDHRQGRRDGLQSVAPLRRAGRRHHEGQRPVRGRRLAGRARRSSSRPMSIPTRHRSRRPTAIPRPPMRAPRVATSSLRSLATSRSRRWPCCRSSRSRGRAKARRRRRTPTAARPSRRSAGTYTVQSGDTLSRIARNTGVSVAAIKQANGMDDGVNPHRPELKIPAGGTAKVASAATSPDPVTTGTAGLRQDRQAGAGRLLHAAEEDREGHRAGGRDRRPTRPASAACAGRCAAASSPSYGNGGGKSNDGIDIRCRKARR